MITYLIIDDETAAHEIICDYAAELPYLVLQKNCYSALEAMEHLSNHKVDLIFLDINMPKLSGFQFLKTLTNPPKVIVTTAYADFALEGFELNVLDYLLKPFSFSRFITAINKLEIKLAEKSLNTGTMSGESMPESIFIKDNKKHIQLQLNELLFVEAYGNYIKLHLKDRTLTTHQTLSSLEKQLRTAACRWVEMHR